MDDTFQFRNRTETELKSRQRGLEEFAEVLERLGARYFLADGALLGAVRNGDFIPWDDDVGIWMKAEDFRILVTAITAEIESSGFHVTQGHRRNPKLNIYMYGEKFELESWRRRGTWRVRWGLKIPAHLLDNPGQIQLRGRFYPCPNPHEEFLEHRYGEDWKTPIVGRGTHAVKSKTEWSLLKKRIRQQTPEWVLKVLGKQ